MPYTVENSVKSHFVITRRHKDRNAFFGLAFVIATMLAVVSWAGAGTIEEDVMNYSGPVYNTYAWKVVPLTGSVSSGTFTITGLPLAGIFTPTYPAPVSTPVGPQNVTAVNTPSSLNNPGVIAIDIDASHPSNDYFDMEIDTGYKNGKSANMQSIFYSTNFLGVGPEGGKSGYYWYAFQGNAGSIFGGFIDSNPGGDIKAFSILPTPKGFLGGVFLMACLSMAAVGRRLIKSPRPSF